MGQASLPGARGLATGWYPRRMLNPIHSQRSAVEVAANSRGGGATRCHRRTGRNYEKGRTWLRTISRQVLHADAPRHRSAIRFRHSQSWFHGCATVWNVPALAELCGPHIESRIRSFRLCPHRPTAAVDHSLENTIGLFIGKLSGCRERSGALFALSAIRSRNRRRSRRPGSSVRDGPQAKAARSVRLGSTRSR